MKSRMGCIQYTVAINEERERERERQRQRERGANCDLLHSIQLVGFWFPRRIEGSENESCLLFSPLDIWDCRPARRGRGH